jgi:hypothetical protein
MHPARRIEMRTPVRRLADLGITRVHVQTPARRDQRIGRRLRLGSKLS